MKNTLFFAIFVLWISLMSLSLSAQTLGEVTGQISDSTGAAVAGASVTATNAATNAARNTVSNEAGVYVFPSLAPGAYHIKVEKPGFKTATTTQVEVQV